MKMRFTLVAAVLLPAFRGLFVDAQGIRGSPGEHVRLLEWDDGDSSLSSSSSSSFSEEPLDDEKSWTPPTEDEYAKLLTAELNKEVRVNGTIDMKQAMSEVILKLLREAPIHDNTTLDALKFMHLPNHTTPELLELEEVVRNAINVTSPKLENAVQIKNFIKELLNGYILAGEEPDAEDIYLRLKDEMGVDGSTADKLIEGSPGIRKYLKSQFRKVGRLVIKKKLKPEALKVAKQLIEAGHNGTDLLHSVANMPNTLDEIAHLMKVVGPDVAREVEMALLEPEQKLKENIESYKNTPSNHTHFVETNDTANGHRKLRFVPHPNTVSIQDHQEEIQNRRRGRRLSRRLFPKDTSEFRKRMADHAEQLHSHVRKLTITCVSGETNSRCVADHLVDELAGVSTVLDQIQSRLDPLDDVLGQLSTAASTFEDAADIGNLVYNAVFIGKNIPGAVKLIFTPVESTMRPINDALGNADTKIQQFHNNVLEVWEQSIGRVEAVIARYDDHVVRMAGQAAGALAFLQESTCARALSTTMAGWDVTNGLDNHVGQVKDFVNSFVSALNHLRSILQATSFRNIQNSLQTFADGVAPLQRFFHPFQPLADLLQEEIDLPWIALPYSQSRLGIGHCNSGYHKGGWPNEQTCWENESSTWEERGGLSTEMQYTCRHGGMSNHYLGGCANSCYGRSWHGYTHSDGWIWVRISCSHGRIDSCPPSGCMARCGSGYTQFCNECCSGCPSGFSRSWDGGRCDRSYHRPIMTHTVRCTNYQHRVRSGRNIELSGDGTCYESCASSDTKIFGECFPRPTLTLSIAGVMDALAVVMAFITGLPIVSTIMDAIDTIVGVVLRPVTNQISRWTRDLGISPPAFPDINVNSINFSGFNAISLPTFPNAQQFATAADRLNNKMLTRLPAPFNNIGSCGADIDCISRQIGMGSLSDFAGQMFDLVEEMDLSNMQEQMITYLEGFSCRRWNSYTVDVDQITRAISLGSVSGACDIVFPYCDRVGNEVDPSGLNDAFQPVVNFVDALTGGTLTGGRRLRGGGASRSGSSGSTWLPIFGFEVQADFMGNNQMGSFGGQVSFSALRVAPDNNSQEVDAGDLLGRSRSTDHRRDRILGMHIRGVAGFVIEIGILVRDGRWSAGIKFGPKVELKLGETGSALSRMRRVVGMYGEIDGFTEISETSPHYNADYNECRIHIRPADGSFCNAINDAATLSRGPPPTAMSLTTMQSDMRGYTRLDERNPEHLSISELRQMTAYENQFQEYSNYWENLHNEIRKKVVEAHGHDSVSVDSASGSPLFKKRLGKIIRDLSQLKLKSEWIARNIPGQTTASSALSFWNDIGEADDLLQLGIGVEMEDYDTGTRIGPIFQLKPKVDGTPFAGWNLGEMRMDTLWSIARAGVNKARGIRDMQRSMTEYTDKMYSITGTVDMLGIFDSLGDPVPRINNVDGDPDTSVNKLQVCEGDCDRNSDCAEGLVCFQRNGNEQVPGCRGESPTHVSGYVAPRNAWDYCILPQLNDRGWSPDTSVNKLQQCEGDCDRNSDCAQGLVCLERTGSGTGGQVPGCNGNPTNGGFDYCVTP